MTQAIPVTVIGGYLGAGKTTLVNHLLRHAAGRRLAVLVNDFGELPIDADLIESNEGGTIAIAGGCVCCSFGSDLVAALQQLAGRDPVPDHVLIEASGVALPGAVAAAVTLLPRYRVDGVLVLADAETVRERAADRYLADTVSRQLDEADLILLAKGDLVTESARASLRQWLAGRAPLVEVQRGQVPLDLLLGRRAEARGRLHAPMRPHPAYDSCSFAALPPLDVLGLAAALAGPGTGVLRAKGLLRDCSGATKALHVVGRRAEAIDASAAPSGLVCIGLRGRLARARIESIVEKSTSEITT